MTTTKWDGTFRTALPNDPIYSEGITISSVRALHTEPPSLVDPVGDNDSAAMVDYFFGALFDGLEDGKGGN